MSEPHAYYEQYMVHPVEPRPSDPTVRTRPNGTVEPTQVGMKLRDAPGKRLTPPAGRRVDPELLEALADGTFEMKDVRAEDLNQIALELMWRRRAAKRKRRAA